MTDSLELIRVAGIHAAVQSPDVAHLVIGLNEVISSRTVPGLDVQPEPTAEGVRIVVRVAAGAVIAHPVHMCFGLVQERGVQKIDLDLAVGDGGRLGVIAHCVFPAAVDVQHLMDADIRVGRDAHYSYSERHIHSETGGVNVVPKARVALAENARYRTDFELLAGRVGRIAMDYETTCAAGSVLEMTARIKARADDESLGGGGPRTRGLQGDHPRRRHGQCGAHCGGAPPQGARHARGRPGLRGHQAARDPHGPGAERGRGVRRHHRRPVALTTVTRAPACVSAGPARVVPAA